MIGFASIMEDLQKIQEDRLQRLTKAEVNHRKCPKDRITQGYLETRLEILETLWTDFTETHRKIIAEVSMEQRGTSRYFTNDVYDKFEELYIGFKGSVRESLRKKSSTVMQPVSEKPTTSDVKLPRIQLPTFSGKYSEWQPFFDLFTSVIHNNKSLSSVQKLHYLKSTLTGEAETLIQNLPTTELNYETAWERLTKRYDNKRYNCNAIMKTLFSQKQISTESASAIKTLLDTTTSCLTSLNNLDINTESWDAMIIFLVVSKLDHESLRQWEINISGIPSNVLPTWKDLVLFLESRFRTLEMIDSSKQVSKSSQPNIPNTKKVEKSVKSFAAVHDGKDVTKSQCVMCSGDHYLYQCKGFGQLTPREQQEFVQSKTLCYNCLAPTHSVRKCRQSSCCRRCGRRHHSLLHQERDVQQGPTNNSETTHTISQRPTNSNNEVKVVANFAKEDEMVDASHVLLATAIVKSYSRSGQSHLFRALIDQGSQASFVTEETVQLLGLKRSPVSGCVSGLGDDQLRIKHMVSLRVESRKVPSDSIQVTAYVLKSLTSQIPKVKVQSPHWLDIEDFSLADEGYTSPGRIDLLLGAEVYSEILLNDMRKHPQGHLLAQNTIFGWVISGRVSQSTSAKEHMVSLHVRIREDNSLKQFWKLENESDTIMKRFVNTEQKREEVNKSTTFRNIEGRYGVKLPFDSKDQEYQHERLKEIAERRFYFLKNKFKKNTEFKKEYAEIIQKYMYSKHVIQTKGFIQNLWKLRLSWDNKLPEDVVNEWLSYRKRLIRIKTIFIPWQYLIINNYDIKIYVFADASQLAYATVVFLLSINYKDKIQIHLVTTNTKDALIEKKLSIAILKQSQIFIQEDERVINSLDIKSLVAIRKENKDRYLEEEKNLFWSKYSSLKKMLRIASYVRRFCLRDTTGERYSEVVTVKEMNESLLSCVKQVQYLQFSEEIKQLKSGGIVPKKSDLHALNPFLDEKGLLKVGGRIHHAKLSYDERHPLIMPELSHLTQVIIADAHNSTMHGGPQVMLNYIRSRYWIIRARQQVKKYFRRCFTCIRYSQRKNTPLMGQLPEVRLKPSKPFKSSGVDYAGPVNIRFSPGRGSKSYKGYICLFVCKVTRAIHLEAVSDLTSKGFIAAFRRFIGRRGRCQDLYSDNGTNFVGADKELRDVFNNTKSRMPQELAEILTMEGTTWHYIPPLSPNFGGLWEAGVRSAKTHLRKVIGDSTLTYEELSTVLIQIESCLNSRPLSQLSDHPVDPLPLTPGHFLVGEPLINLYDDYSYNQTSNVTGLERWRLVQKMINNFWERWSKDYLLNLDKRYKWSTEKTEPDIDDIVIIREDNVPPTKWILGRIVQKHPGKDNVTRVVTVKCKDKLLKPPVNKLCFLPK